ncbi:MAG: hypothetical protein ACTSWC_05245 [Promethearchaeota archaeon]
MTRSRKGLFNQPIRDLIRNLEKIGDELNNFFSPKSNPNDNELKSEQSELDLSEITPEEKEELEKELPLPMKIARGWQDFVLNTQKTLEQFESEMQQNHLRRLERMRKRQKNARQRRLERIKKREERLEKKFKQEMEEFEAANQRLNEEFLAMQNDLYQKKSAQRDKFHSNLAATQNKWERVSRKRQRNIEGILKGINRWGWRQQLRIVLILIPLIVVLVLVIILIRPFLTVI